MKFFVKQSPWPTRLEIGTEIIRTTPRYDDDKSNWFARKDGKLLFDSEADGKFVLFEHEFTITDD